MLIKIAAMCVAMSFATIAAAAPTIYTDETAFNAAITGATNTEFTFAGYSNLGTSYTLGPVTFASSNLVSYKDAYGVPPGVVPYLGSFGPLLTIDSTTSGLGLHLGSYFGVQTVTYTINGVIGTLSVPAPNSTAFIGFRDLGPIHVTFTNNSELDTVRFTTGSGAVPEPMTWAMLGVGFGLVGAAVRRRKVAVAA